MLHPFLHFLARRDPQPEHKADLLRVAHLIGPHPDLWCGDCQGTLEDPQVISFFRSEVFAV